MASKSLVLTNRQALLAHLSTVRPYCPFSGPLPPGFLFPFPSFCALFHNFAARRRDLPFHASCQALGVFLGPWGGVTVLMAPTASTPLSRMIVFPTFDFFGVYLDILSACVVERYDPTPSPDPLSSFHRFIGNSWKLDAPYYNFFIRPPSASFACGLSYLNGRFSGGVDFFPFQQMKSR